MRRLSLRIMASLRTPVSLLALVCLTAGCDNEKPHPADESSQDLTPQKTSSEAPVIEASKPPFENVGRDAGILFMHDHCGTGERYMVETNCSGVAWLDFDNDGLLDLYFNQGAPAPGVRREEIPANCLYHNQGQGVFVEMAKKAGVDDRGIGMGVSCADYDGDGWQDIYVCNYETNRLFRNRGDMTFEDVTESAGVGESRWTSTACFCDLDLDGDLDLYLANYVDFHPSRKKQCGVTKNGVTIPMYCHPDVYDGHSDTLYRNNGDGTFTDISNESGILEGVNYVQDSKGLCVIPCDYDDDGDLDLFVANDAAANFFFRNDGDLKFVNIATDAGVAYNAKGKTESCMGSDWADVDGDGDFDLVTCNIQDETNTLWRNDSGGFFSDVSERIGIGLPSMAFVGFSVEFFDYDNDGDDDLFVSNGHMIDNIKEFNEAASFEQKDHLFQNQGGKKGFRLVSETMGGYFDEAFVGRAAAVGDYDNDGDLDIAINNMGGPGLLIRNNVGQEKNWIGFKLEGEDKNSAAIGARVRVIDGKRKQSQEIRGTVALGSFSDLRLSFGLGDATAVDSVEIRWPRGRVQHLSGEELKINQYHAIREKP